MKLIHISDIHIHSETILNSDPVHNFETCMDHVSRNNGDADMVIISGDLTHHGSRASYEKLRGMLDGWAIAPFLIPGNHDDRATFCDVFPETRKDDDGFVQYVHDTPLGRFLFLDTLQPGTHCGHYCQQRQTWLTGQLEKAKTEGKPVYLVMHHNPVDVGVANADAVGLVDGEAFRAILAPHRSNIRHIFFGHCHYILSGSVSGIPFSAPRSTSHVCIPEFTGADRMGFGDFPPNYNVCLLSDEATVVHSIDFMDEAKIQWLDASSDGWVEDDHSY
ncbi:MAG: phosphodiesterase [Pseudomonadota bacterium]